MHTKYSLLALGIPCLLYSCTNHPRIETFREGSYIVKATVIGNKRNGPTELYDKSGKLMRIANYKSDILDGTMIHYYSDGVVADSVEYKCGKKYGYFRK